ncbi:DUF47 domain-containing protein [Lampropedia puyangensis]|uniref:DUF47 domain-containing protein n=1 Tax=Lampropedia puyangensis TaxID=1330072 RepID=A0A4S8ESI2_9BURK|nr:DUF47 family protein [Lampropedia puyangensis]THT97829.1 DUF47 domain-containing protein [Lampropedia puyangensis]
MLFGKLLPREGNFFALFNQHANHIGEAAEALVKLIANYSDAALRAQYTAAIDEAESAADSVTALVNKTIHQTFITPIDREQIHSLINTMDDVADLIQDVAETLVLYDVQSITQDMRSLADLDRRCVDRVRAAIATLDKIADSSVAEAALKTCEEIDQLEDDADRVLRSAMSALFRQEENVRELIKLKAIYELLETVSDRCQDVANIIEGIVLENS